MTESWLGGAMGAALLAAVLAPSATLRAQAPAEDAWVASAASVIRVGPRHAVRRVAEAARVAKDGYVVEIEAGEYRDDVASWPQSRLTIRAVGGRARMVSTGKSAEGKAIWVIKGDNVTVENIEFSGARVPSRNGAGIRHEGGRLIIRNCLFEHNQMGLLTWNRETAELKVEASEFRNNAVAQTYKEGDPIGHQIYVGTIGRFELRESYVHHGAFGHLVKSRARENHIFYNRIADEAGGRASYELEFPNGGVAYVIGNIIQQSLDSENPNVISFGVEGYKWPRNELYLVNNTLMDNLPRNGRFLTVEQGAHRIKAFNNVLIGGMQLEASGPGDYAANYKAEPSDIDLTDPQEYRLKRKSKLVGKAVAPGEDSGITLRLQSEYVHPLRSRALGGDALHPGAHQRLAP